MKKKKKSYKYFFHYMGISLALVLLLVFAASLLTPSRKFSPKENRVLSSRPKTKLSQAVSGRFSKDYETYVNDQFPLRDMWVTLKAGCDRLMGRVEENGVFLGKDGFLLEAFNPPADQSYLTTQDAMCAFAAGHPELKQYAMIVPNAVSILENKLPVAAPVKDQDSFLEDTAARLEEGGITFIDVRSTLKDHLSEGLYYHTDHHWTTQAAYYAYVQSADILGFDASSPSYEKVPVSESFQGTLSAKSGFRSGKKEELCVFLPDDTAPSSVVNYVDEQKKSASFYDTSKLEGRDKYALFLGGNHAQLKISTPIEENRTLLVLKDSYANCFLPFLAPHYRSIIVVDPRYYYGDLEELIQVENIQEVLYLYNANTFYSDTSLELLLGQTPASEAGDGSAA